MKLEEQVCSLELAKKLKELGVKQESLWYWVNYISVCGYEGERVWLTNKEKWHIGNNLPSEYDFVVSEITEEAGWCNYMAIEKTNLQKTYKACSAFTVAELGELLPEESYKQCYVTFKAEDGWKAWELENGLYDEGCFIFAKTEADARAKMLIYLIESNLLESKEV